MERPTRSLTLFALVAAGLFASGTAPAASQEMEAPLPTVDVAPDHWVYPLLDRMAADGLLAGVWLPGRRPVDARAIGTALDSAVARAGAGSVWAGTAVSARSWLRAEYAPGARGYRVAPVVGVRAADGPRTDATAFRAGARLQYQPVESVGLWAEPMPEVTGEGVDLPTPSMGAAWRSGPFRVAASYGPRRLGPGASGGIVLHDDRELGWVELGLAEPVTLPWLLRYLGPVTISAAGSRIAADSTGPTVGFVSGEFRLQPFPWITLGLYRTAAIVSERDGETLGLDDLWLMFLGNRSGASANFDDQKASMSASVQARVLGLSVNPYFVWGWEDTWEIDEDPGTILGIWLPTVPVAGQPVGVRYEYTAFGDDGRLIWPWSNDWAWRDWYRKDLRGRSIYSESGHLLGHPLGGYGSGHRIDVDLAVPDGGITLNGSVFTWDRIRGTTDNPGFGPPRTVTYSNLLYDVMPGRSWGGSLRGTLSAGRFLAGLAMEAEIGEEGWRRAAITFDWTWLLP